MRERERDREGTRGRELERVSSDDLGGGERGSNVVRSGTIGASVGRED